MFVKCSQEITLLLFFLPKSEEHKMQRHYGCLGFIGDVLMVVVTGGLWLIFIFIREMRGRNSR